MVIYLIRVTENKVTEKNGNTITYPKMEHLAKLLHHAMKTALFPLFFLPSCN